MCKDYKVEIYPLGSFCSHCCCYCFGFVSSNKDRPWLKLLRQTFVTSVWVAHPGVNSQASQREEPSLQALLMAGLSFISQRSVTLPETQMPKVIIWLAWLILRAHTLASECACVHLHFDGSHQNHKAQTYLVPKRKNVNTLSKRRGKGSWTGKGNSGYIRMLFVFKYVYERRI